MLKFFLFTSCLTGIFSTAFVLPDPEFKTSLISSAGKYVPLPEAAHQPKPGAKIVFDVTEAGNFIDIVKGLDKVALYLNLAAENGPVAADSYDITVVLHGNATRAALNDKAFRKLVGLGGAQNPNLPLIRELKKYGVKVYVCGQALARNDFPQESVAEEVTVAVSAITVIVNEQNQGAAYLPY